MNISAIAPFSGSCRQARIVGLSIDQVSAILGVAPVGPSADGKCLCEWYFKADGYRCAVWDWHNSATDLEFSAFGPMLVLVAIFGADHVGR